MTYNEALTVAIEAARSWADELSDWIIPGTYDEDDAEGYQARLDELNYALTVIEAERSFHS